MKRRGFLAAAVGGTGGAAVRATGAEAKGAEAASAEAAALVRTPAVVMAPRADGAEIVWAVSRLSRGWVELDGGRRVGSDGWGFVPQGDKVLRVRLDGLPAGTSHRFRAVTEAMPEGERVEGPWRSFRTLDPAAASTRFAVWNDTHQNEETVRRLDQVTPEVDFLLWNGDTCNDWHSEDLIVPSILHPAGTDFTARRPLLFAWGNHDVRGPFGFRVPHYVATPAGRPYYAFRSGPLAALVLHTGEDKPDDHPSFKGRVAFDQLRREQAEWIRRTALTDPALRDAPLRVVFCHLPLRWTDEGADAGYDYFSKRSRDHWHGPLAEWGAQVVVAGHTHRPGWFEAGDGFPYAQLVGGGPQPGGATWIEGVADDAGLRLTMRRLDGGVVREVTFPRIGTR